MAWTTVSDCRLWPKHPSAATKRLVTSDRSAHSKSDFWFDEATLCCSYISSPLPIISSDNNQVPDSSSTLELNVKGTIYEASGFDDDLRIEINPTKIKFIKELKTSEASSIFHVNYDGMPRVLKVFHNNEDAGYADDGVRDLNRARCEIRAYCSLKRSGICNGGYVPQFYGYTLSLHPTALAPHLDAFQCDTDLLSAILIEYLPNPLLWLSTMILIPKTL
ncbi:conserved hypothetical protein [Histoplasma capsulatum var. duboisii H88]|uniref:Uncharacterized protein n=1 Tax=Ajellomyces capsulatus (strain H88) TaxID=544711 RepID=F0UTM8_AJEC8|nr:conserved hypothetical protein [Histoplasma capsulatum var. duboisii H88]